MAELARGAITDRPWGRTLGALGLRGVTGQITLAGADGKRFAIVFVQGAVAGAVSPLPTDAAVRVAMTAGLISSSHVAEITRRQTAQPQRDEVDLIVELMRLTPDHATRLRRRVNAQRAARTFAPERGEFQLTDTVNVPYTQGAELDVRAIIYLGARANLTDLRLDYELSQMGAWFCLKSSAIPDLPQYGFGDAERPLLELLRVGASLGELEQAHHGLDPRGLRAVLYALASCNAVDVDPSSWSSGVGAARGQASPRAVQSMPAQRPAQVSTPDQPTSRPAQTLSLEQPTSRPAQTLSLDQPTSRPAQTLSLDQPTSRPAQAPRAVQTLPQQQRPGAGQATQLPHPSQLQATQLPHPSQLQGRTPPAQRAPQHTPAQPQPVAPARAIAAAAADARPRLPSDGLDAPTVRKAILEGPPRAMGLDAPTVRHAGASASAPRRPRSRTGPKSPEQTLALIRARLDMLVQGADHFTLLGVPTSAQPKDIETAYLALAKQLHPDKLKAAGIDEDTARDAQRLFAQVNSAVAVLRDPTRRADYIAILARGGEAAVRAEDAKAGEMAMRILDAEEAFRRGEMAMRQNNLSAAVGEMRRAIELNPDEPDYHAMLAWAQFVASPDKNVAAASTRSTLERAVRQQPNATTARLLLGRVERLLGRDADAMRHFQDVLRMDPHNADATAEMRVLQQRRR